MRAFAFSNNRQSLNLKSNDLLFLHTHKVSEFSKEGVSIG
jgi:hypothetical protein